MDVKEWRCIRLVTRKGRRLKIKRTGERRRKKEWMEMKNENCTEAKLGT